MNLPQILTGQEAIEQFGLKKLIECRVAVTTELNGLGHSVMQIGVIADPDSCQIDEDDTGVLWVEYQGADDWYLYSIPADEQFVLLYDKNQPESNAVLADQHPDDQAVDRFAAAMKVKLAAARAKGRAGWEDKAGCSGEHLAQLLVDHLSKANAGTFEDIANFAMMLHQRDEDPKLLFIALANHVAKMYVHQSTADTSEIKALAVRDFIQWGIRKVDPEFAEFVDNAEFYIKTELGQPAKAGE
ncbi:hypothetical protein [Arsukibacterium indicum]|uniref:Uncharacterized protein n=1 Tax=Arsukibacterium indicum TaxID=2848612 RepID=A0ABS6MHB2_9GAMM|nr:hypothetical protein [Arsukibacterium indicum]MBV2128202.1 hypothetical protein [Arsukibacterium indicum]